MNITDMYASERAMQMICAVTSSGRQNSDMLARINRIVDAWVFYPNKLTPDARAEDLPLTRR